MKPTAVATLILILLGITSANGGGANKFIRRVADASEVCLANCQGENQSCKRVCPTTYNVPCINACDNRAEFCRQNCQTK
jgi:hypothetical protein